MKSKTAPHMPVDDNQHWQDAVDFARVLLLFHTAQQYGLVTGGPVVNPRCCEELLQEGRRRGIVPLTDAAERWLQQIA